MTKNNRNPQRPALPQVQPIEPVKDELPVNIQAEVPVSPSAEPETFDKSDTVPAHRRCPLCWGRCRGVGVSYSKQGTTRYYKCKRTLTEQAACGHTWTATVKTEVTKIQHHVVHLDGQS